MERRVSGVWIPARGLVSGIYMNIKALDFEFSMTSGQYNPLESSDGPGSG